MTTLFDKFYDTNDGQIPSFNTCQHNIFIVALSEPEWCLATKNVRVMKEQYIKLLITYQHIFMNHASTLIFYISIRMHIFGLQTCLVYFLY